MLSASTSASAAAWGRKQAAMGVLSATLVGLENRTTNLSAPVRLAFADDDANASLVPSRCVYWDWNAGAWAGTGCALAADDDTCVCSHLTYFALLFVCRCFFRAFFLDVQYCSCRGTTDVYLCQSNQDVTQSAGAGGGGTATGAPPPLSPIDKLVLNWISLIGCSVSIVALLITILVYLVLKCAARHQPI